MSTCKCDGTVSGVVQVLPDSFYHLGGTTSPTEDAVNACSQAIANMQAAQIDPCDQNYDEVLQLYFQNALTDITNVEKGTPVSNAAQKAADVALGTATSTTAITPGHPGGTPQATNMLFIIGAIVLLAIGFVLVFK